jgi:hypothetical protein
MPKPSTVTSDDYLSHRPPSAAELFDRANLWPVGLSGRSGSGKTATAIATGVKRAEQSQQALRDRALIVKADEERRDDRALKLAGVASRSGKPVPERLRVRAARAARRQGYDNISTAERMAARYLERS